jgi:hypothetical protein
MIDLYKYDAVDFGSGFGGCIDFAKTKLGANRILGFEKHSGRCAALQEKGYACVETDITKLTLPKNAVSFVTMSHVLEHLVCMEDAHYAIRLAVHTAQNFVYIEGPAFEFDQYLENRGLKFAWRDGHGHDTKITVQDIISYAVTLPIAGYSILVEHPLINNSLSKDIHPLASPPHMGNYDSNKHPLKDHVKFDKYIYRSFIIFLWLHKSINVQPYLVSRSKFKKHKEKWLI